MTAWELGVCLYGSWAYADMGSRNVPVLCVYMYMNLP